MDSEAVLRTCTIVGSCLLMFPTGVHWYWGNLATYALSYVRMDDTSVEGSESSWVLSIFHIVRTFSMILSGYLIRRVGKRTTTLIGILTFNCGIIASYFAVQRSMVLLNLTLGGICGLGAGTLYGTSLEYPVEWAGNHLGLVVSLIQSSYNIGAVMLNQVLTWYINPENTPPSLDNGKYAYFSQSEIITRVPSAFGILFILSVTLQVIGIFIVREKRHGQQHKTKVNTNTKEIETTTYDSDPTTITVSEERHMTTWEILQTIPFYIFAVTYFFGEFSYLLITGYYKIFGQLMIKDDHFLSVLGTVNVFILATVKTLLGHITDILPLKMVLIANYVLMTVSSCFLFVTPRISRWLYSFTVIVLSSATSLPVVTATVGMVKVYGVENLSVNTGLVMAMACLMDIIAPPVFKIILRTGGWSNLFYSSSGASMLCFLVIVFFLPAI